MNRDLARRLARIEREQQSRLGEVRYDVSPSPEGVETRPDDGRALTAEEWAARYCGDDELTQH